MAHKDKPGLPVYKKVVLEDTTIDVYRRRVTGLRAKPYSYILVGNVVDDTAADVLIAAQKLID